MSTKGLVNLWVCCWCAAMLTRVLADCLWQSLALYVWDSLSQAFAQCTKQPQVSCRLKSFQQQPQWPQLVELCFFCSAGASATMCTGNCLAALALSV